MTTDREIERILDRWLADGPSDAPDRIVDDLADRIARVGQRPAVRLDRRPFQMNLPVKLAWLAAAVVVVAVAGYALLPRPAVNVGGPSPTPTFSSRAPTPTPAPTAFVCDDGGTTACAGDLGPGIHTTKAFSPAFSFTLPTDSPLGSWRNTYDIARTYTLRPPGGTYSFLVYSQNAIPEQNDSCTPTKKAGAPDTVDAWVAYLTTHPGLVASTPKPISIGGYSGMQVTFRRADSWTKTCPNSIGPAIVTITDSGPAPARVKFVDDQVESFLIVDVDGRTVIVEISSAPSAVAHEADLQAAQPIIGSIEFSAPTLASAAPTSAPNGSHFADDLVGNWTRVVPTCADQNAALQRAGYTADQLTLGEWDAATCDGMVYAQAVRVDFLRTLAPEWADGSLRVLTDSGETVWEGFYHVVDSDTVVAGDSRDASIGVVPRITYTVSIDGNQLVMDVVDDRLPGLSESDRWADVIAQTVIYESLPFTRE